MGVHVSRADLGAAFSNAGGSEFSTGPTWRTSRNFAKGIAAPDAANTIGAQELEDA